MKLSNSFLPRTTITTYKQNQHIKRHFKLKRKVEQEIQEWKDDTDRVVFTNVSNQPKHKKTIFHSRSRLSTAESAIDDLEDPTRKVSSIQILKRQAIFLDSEIQDYNKIERIVTQPDQRLRIQSVNVNNWVRTSKNGFFRAQQRHSILQKKRSKIKNIRKIDIRKLNYAIQQNNYQVRLAPFDEIEQVNKPVIVYPFMDSFYEQEIKQKLSHSFLNGKRSLQKQRNKSLSTQVRYSQPIIEDIKSTISKTSSNWRSEMKLSHHKTQNRYSSKNRCILNFL